MTIKEEKYEEWRRYFFEVDKEMYKYFIQDLERLEVLEKENKIIKNSILGTTQYEWINENHKLQQENEKLKKAIVKELALLNERRETFWFTDSYDEYAVVNEIIEELKEVLGDA
jgi:hypothetical protein